ncbi:MAG: GNAT family N-acetyltransferase [Terriglobales bacterium]
MIYRTLTQADVEQVHALDQSCFPPGIAYSANEIAAYLRLHGLHQGCIGKDGSPLLGLLLSCGQQQRGHIITLDVDADARRRGIGQQLMRNAEQYYRERGARGMRLEAAVNNAGALAFYARLGYRVVRRLAGYYAADLDALQLDLDF